MRSCAFLLISLSLAGCDVGTYTPGVHHGGEEASVGSHLSGVDTGSTDGAAASTAVNGHFGAGTATGSR